MAELKSFIKTTIYRTFSSPEEPVFEEFYIVNSSLAKEISKESYDLIREKAYKPLSNLTILGAGITSYEFFLISEDYKNLILSEII